MKYHQAAPPRAQDLVFTLFGDYLLDRPRPIWVGSLIALLEPFGVSPAAARVVLSRMTQRGWLTAVRRGGRGYYGLTPRARRLLTEGRERIYHPPRNESWHGTWYLVTYSIPERQRHLRDALRIKLQWLGCGPLANAVWITPHDVRAEVREIATALKIARHLEVFRAEHQGFSTTSDLVAHCWDLSAINRRYAGFVSHWRPALDHCAACRTAADCRPGGAVPAPCLSAKDCFVRRFQLVHEFRRFPLEDPFLPPPLLPGEWKGDEAARIFETYHTVLAEPAIRYVRDVCDAGDALNAKPAA
jgi:phenylacetic acid degradation operon negative regulatory protein